MNYVYLQFSSDFPPKRVSNAMSEVFLSALPILAQAAFACGQTVEVRTAYWINPKNCVRFGEWPDKIFRSDINFFKLFITCSSFSKVPLRYISSTYFRNRSVLVANCLLVSSCKNRTNLQFQRIPNWENSTKTYRAKVNILDHSLRHGLTSQVF